METKKKILDALENLITCHGFTAVGVNAVAREAGIDKVLIYRYFGSMEGLLKSFAEEKDLCPSVSNLLADLQDGAPFHEIAAKIVIEHANALQKSPLAQELVCWELTEQNPLSVLFGKEMEQRGLNALANRGIIPNKDSVMLSVILLCGLQYLILRGRNKNPMMNIDYSKAEIREDIERVISLTIKAFYDTHEGSPN